MFTPNKVVSKKVMMIIAVSQTILFLAFWILFAPRIIPRPLEILDAFGPLWKQGVAVELWTSFKTNLLALFYTTLITFVVSYLTVLPVMRAPAGVISKMRYLGLTGLTLIFTLVFGGGANLKVSIIVFGMSVFAITSMVAMVSSIPRDAYDHARTLRYSEWHAVWEVLVRGKLDEFIEIMRQNLAIGWMMLAMVEGLVRSEGGIGSLLLNQSKYFNLSAVFAIQLMIFLTGLFMDWFVGVLKSLFCQWADLNTERR